MGTKQALILFGILAVFLLLGAFLVFSPRGEESSIPPTCSLDSSGYCPADYYAP